MFLKQLNRVLQGVFFLSIPSFLAQPLMNMLGLGLQPPVGNLFDTLRFLLIIGVVVFVLAIALVLGLGYLVLTGWRGYRRIPFALRIAFAFLIGLSVFSLAAPLGLLLPIPFASITLATIGLWGLLRSISSFTLQEEELPMSIVEAELLGSSYIASRQPSVGRLTPTGAIHGENSWTLQYSSEAGVNFEVKVDSKKRKILNMRRL